MLLFQELYEVKNIRGSYGAEMVFCGRDENAGPVETRKPFVPELVVR
jgi:hypothetical protein